MPDAVVFDLDGVLLDSEQRWNEAREAVARETGGHWRDEAVEIEETAMLPPKGRPRRAGRAARPGSMPP